MFSRVSSKEIAVFTRQFGVMIKAGVPVVSCLRTMSGQSANKRFRDVIEEIADDVESGLSLHETFGRKRRIFGDLYVAMVRAGEEGGFLGQSLKNVAAWLDKSEAIQRKIKGAMAYPAVIFVVAIGVMVFMLVKVIPTFAEMFTGMGAELPGLTNAILVLSSFMINYISLIVLIIIALVFGMRYLMKNERVRFTVDKLVMSLPLFGILIRKTAISRFAATMSSLLSSGVPMVAALRITASTSGNKVIENVVLSSADRISAGESIVGPLKDSGVFPPMVTQLIATGEEGGQIPDMLQNISAFYDEEVDTAVGTLTSVMEPIMIVFMGAIVGVIIIAMYLPMFDLLSHVR